ncbi:hypothetical protein PC116_g29762 [Phytophthora cactorum]|nr:hypothetical protein PC116_g29762 [Phytophthora cactorum]
MSTKDMRAGLDKMPTELLIPIFSHLPDVRSMNDFGLVSKKYQNILKENESEIARRFTTRTLRDTDPGVMRLAFTTCKARSYDYFYYGNVEDPFDGGLDFLDTYVERGDWPSQFYQIRALTWLPALSDDVEAVLGWVLKNIAPLPAGLEGEGFTPTEITRQRRLLYMIDFMAKFLIKSRVPRKNDSGFRVLFHALWSSFSPVEIYLAFELMTRLMHYLQPSQRMVRSIFELSGYKEQMKAFISMTRKKLPSVEDWVPLINDPNAFIKDTIPSDPEDDDSLMDYYYYDPRQYESLMKKYLHSHGTNYWFFLIGDKDRCELVKKRGPVWTWEAGTNPALALLGDPIIVWRQDPARFGCPGIIGTKVPYYQLCQESQETEDRQNS